MSHMVIFRSAEGKAGYHQTESLDEAIRFVEHLRNQEHVPETRIFRMQEVPIEVKTYYKVEVSPSGPESSPASNPPASAPVVSAPRAEPERAQDKGQEKAQDKVTVPADEPIVVEPMAPNNAGAGGGRFGRFNRS